MPSETETKAMPILPILPDFDSLLDDDPGLSARLSAALYLAAHRFVKDGVKAKRDFASAYTAAITRYLQSLSPCAFFGALETKIVAGVEEAKVDRKRCVRFRRDSRRRLDSLGRNLPANVHNTLVSYVALGERCGRLAA